MPLNPRPYGPDRPPFALPYFRLTSSTMAKDHERGVYTEFASSLKRCAFSIAVVALAGCGGSPSQSATRAIPQALTAEHEHGRSWMLPEEKKEDLLYVADSFCGCIRIFSYPKGKVVGVIQDVAPQLQGECSDKAGNVWVTSFRTAQLVEFAHGEPLPIGHLYVYPPPIPGAVLSIRLRVTSR